MGINMIDVSTWSLRQSPLFDRVHDKTVASLARLFGPSIHPRRKRLFEQGDPGQTVYLIGRGGVRLERLTKDGRDMTLALLGPGDFFGEDAVLEDQLTRTTSATCIEESYVFSARAEDFSWILTRYALIALNLAKYLKEQRDATLSSLEDIVYSSVSSRLLRLLERLAAEYGIGCEDGTRISLRLTQAEIASLIGTTRETVSLELGKLSRSGLVTMQGRQILVRGQRRRRAEVSPPSVAQSERTFVRL
jgi:CRP/FNR family transcriptional regulator, cyclic AMP receptor protein